MMLSKTDDMGRPNHSAGKNKSRTAKMVQKEIDTFNKKSPVRVWSKEELEELNKKSA